MTAPPLDRQRAAARTRLAQIGVFAVIAGGVSIVAFGLPGVKKPPPVEPIKLPEVDIDTGHAPVEEAPKVAMDLAAAADRFGLISNHPVQPAAPPPPDHTKGGEEAPPPPPTPPADDLKFLGVVHLGAMKMALIAKADKQSFIAVGGKIGDDAVSEITDHEIKVGSKTITLTPKGADMVSRVSSSASAGSTVPSGVAKQSNMPGGANSKTNPALAAALAARAAASRAGNPKATPMQQGGSMGAPAAPFPDPVRNGRYQQLLEKYRNGGEFKSETEVAEAAMKQTDNEALTGQLPGFDTSVVKKK